MSIVRLVGFYYLLLCVYLILNVTTVTFTMVLPAVWLMWICYLAFWLGWRTLCHGEKPSAFGGVSVSPLLSGGRRLAAAGVVALCAILAAEYYTGQTVRTVARSLAEGAPLYWQYQVHFAENSLGSFSIEKLPYVMMLITVRLVLIYSFVSLVGIKPSASLGDKAYLLSISLSFMYFSVSRGTSFELLELLVLVVYSLALRGYFHDSGGHAVSGLVRWSVALGVLATLSFSHSISIRGTGDTYVTRELQYDPNALLSRVAPLLSVVSMRLAGYFRFGFYFTSVAMTEVWFGSVSNVFAGSVPGGLKLIGLQSFGGELCDVFIDCGAAWQPDASRYLWSFGLLGLLVICFSLGRLAACVRCPRFGQPSSVTLMLGYFILLQMVSMPIGNFVWISSVNTALFLVLLVLSASGVTTRRGMLRHVRPGAARPSRVAHK